MRSPVRPPNNHLLRQVGLLVLIVVGLYILLPQFGIFRRSLPLLRAAQPHDLLVAVVCTGLTYVFAASSYQLLAFRPLRFSRTLVMQFACMVVNRLLPGGIGGIGANYAYLRASKHTSSQAASVVAVNNTLGAVGHLLLLLGVFITMRHHVGRSHSGTIHGGKIAIIGVFSVIVVIILLGLVPRLRLAAQKYSRQVLNQLAGYRQRPQRVWAALGMSVFLTIGNVLTLSLAASAVHISVSFITVLFILTVGVTLGTLTPTPGGLGGVEAGLVSGLVAYGVGADKALAAVLLFRLVNYWLPLLLGVMAFIYAQRRHYFS